jgi:hypothetical protein
MPVSGIARWLPPHQLKQVLGDPKLSCVKVPQNKQFIDRLKLITDTHIHAPNNLRIN